MKKHKLNLRLFGETADGAEAAEAESAAIEAEQAEDDGQVAEVQRDYEAEFEELIKGDFKDVFAKRTQKIIDKRFKSAKKTEARLEKLNPLLEGLAKRYGVNSDDLDGLQKAFTDDEVYIEYKAMQEGKSTDDVRQEIKTELERSAERQELMALREAEAARQEEEKIRERLNLWGQETESIKSLFPEYDFSQTIAEDPKVVELAVIFSENGFDSPFEAAYKQVHNDELMTTLASLAAKKAAKATADSIAAGRPKENG
ncbi:MAG TPA: hypothetical protein VFF56_01000, partial [Bacillota bacterium]|nr:hypothetical protein [Bacillota bacterium]